MRLARFDDDRAGVVVEDHVLDLTAAAAGDKAGPPLRVPDLCQMGLARALELVERLQAGAPARPLADVRLRAPIGRPGLIAAAPINYGDHQLEMRQQYDVSGLGIFLKAPSSVIGPGDDIQLPYHDRRFDHEGELAVVVGADTRRSVPVEEARSLVFGYTCLLDITMRGGEDRSTRKSFDTFTPIGPWIVTADELTDPGALELTCRVNGAVRQHASTSTLIWDVDRLLGYVSSVLTLSAGDVVSTGTPAGVGPVESGDRVEVTISGIGTLAVGVTDQGAVASPTRGAQHGPVAPPAPSAAEPPQGHAAPEVPPGHRALLDLPVVASLATVRPDGAPQCNPVWFRWDGEQVALSQVATARKVRNLRREPRATLVIVDPANPFRFLEVRGRVVSIEPDVDRAFLRALMARYLGEDAPSHLPDEERVVVRIEPLAFVKEMGHGAGDG